MCPVWEDHGYCPSGITCRWAQSHTQPSDYSQIERPKAEQIPIIEVLILPTFFLAQRLSHSGCCCAKTHLQLQLQTTRSHHLPISATPWFPQQTIYRPSHHSRQPSLPTSLRGVRSRCHMFRNGAFQKHPRFPLLRVGVTPSSSVGTLFRCPNCRGTRNRSGSSLLSPATGNCAEFCRFECGMSHGVVEESGHGIGIND